MTKNTVKYNVEQINTILEVISTIALDTKGFACTPLTLKNLLYIDDILRLGTICEDDSEDSIDSDEITKFMEPDASEAEVILSSESTD